MKFFTVMIIMYTTSQGPVESRVLFPSEADCATAINVFSDQLKPLYDDVGVLCARSDLLSWTIRPKGRGE